jgi:GT2 family glycosyltransferase
MEALTSEAAGSGTFRAEKASSSPRVLHDWTIIIPTVGRPILRDCLQALANGIVRPGCIIVVDQSKEKETIAGWLAELNRLSLRTVHLVSRDCGPALARNLAIDHVQTVRVAAVDDDCVADEHWLEAMNRQLDEHPNFIITGRVDPAGGGKAPTVISSDVPRLYSKPSARFPSPLASGNMACSMQTARRIGQFDGRLFTAEDNDWAHRALRAGIPILYSPEPIVKHVHWRSDSELASTFHDYARGQGQFYGKHLRRGDMLILLMAAISFYRGINDWVQGGLAGDFSRRARGSARVRWLVPAMVEGFLRAPARL